MYVCGEMATRSQKTLVSNPKVKNSAVLIPFSNYCNSNFFWLAIFYAFAFELLTSGNQSCI